MIKSHLTSHSDASMFKTHVINLWKPQREVWPFLYGNDVLGCLSMIGSTALTYSFRKALNLRPYARLTCYSPTVAIPAMGCYLFQSVIISMDVIQANACPLCISLKASLFQSILGVGFPVLLAPIVCLYVADRLLTYPVPPLVKAPKEVFSLCKKIIMKNSRPLLIYGAIQFAAAWFITYKKEKSFYLINSVLNNRKTE